MTAGPSSLPTPCHSEPLKALPVPSEVEGAARNLHFRFFVIAPPNRRFG
jgi:hypothetical protein